MNKPNEIPEQQLEQAGDSVAQRQQDPTRRGQNHIQGEEVATTGGTRDRQPQQSKVPDAEVNGD